MTTESSIALLATVGNPLVIIVSCKYQYPRTTTNYYVMSLATADLLVGLFGIAFATATSVELPCHLEKNIHCKCIVHRIPQDSAIGIDS